MRTDGRGPGEPRRISIERHYLQHPDGSVLVSVGNTKVICTATIEERVPVWLRGGAQGWVTAEYGMLPASTHSRNTREAARGRLGGRTQEIQRLIGRSLRAVVDLQAIGERTVWIDCDVIQADGGTRTSAITGAFVALVDAMHKLQKAQGWRTLPITGWLAAVSVGIVAGEAMLDLCYEEDSRAEVDLNMVMTGDGRIVEVQGTAEREPFTMAQMHDLLALAASGIDGLIRYQREVLGPVAALVGGDAHAPVSRRKPES